MEDPAMEDPKERPGAACLPTGTDVGCSSWTTPEGLPFSAVVRIQASCQNKRSRDDPRFHGVRRTREGLSLFVLEEIDSLFSGAVIVLPLSLISSSLGEPF